MNPLASAADRLGEHLERRGLGQWEAYASRNRVVTVRIATSRVLEVKELVLEGHSARAIQYPPAGRGKGAVVGFASGDGLSSLGETARGAAETARRGDPDPHFHSLPRPRKFAPLPGGWDPRVAHMGLEEAADMGHRALEAAREADPHLDVSGSLHFISEEMAVQNSLGVDAADRTTAVLASITVERETSTGEPGASAMATRGSRGLRGFDPAGAAREAAGSIGEKGPRARVESGPWDVILSPRAMAELLEQELSPGVNAQNLDYGLSYLGGKWGRRVASPRFTLSDDGRHPTGIASKSVDDEGVPTGRTTLIERGVFRRAISDTYYAHKMRSVGQRRPGRRSGLTAAGVRATGNGFRFGAIPGRSHASLPGPNATNLVVEPGDRDSEEVIGETRRGIYIGRLWYTYLVNPVVGEFSTTNRGETYLIRNGRPAGPIPPSSLRINDNILRLLRNIAALSRDTGQSVIWAGISSCISPTVKFHGVRVLAYR
ncbi:MAG: TldD/PmbA family protein [Euryarchaeota archaeon]|nr:TldD/PmbA family protein [Euryarchaeota archaeon]